MKDDKVLWNGQTHFSLGKSLLSPKDLVKNAALQGYTHVALTDYMTINAIPEFTKACEEHSVTPIIGCTFHVIEDATGRPEKGKAKEYRPEFAWPRMYALNEQGYSDIMNLLSQANSEENFYKIPRLSLHQFMNVVNRGNVLATTGTEWSLAYSSMLDRAIAKLNVGDDLLIPEYWNSPLPLAESVNQMNVAFATESELHIWTNPVHYAFAKDADSKDVMRAISTPGAELKSPWVPKHVARDHDIRPLSKRGTLDDVDLDSMFKFKWQKSPISLPEMSKNELYQLKAICVYGFRRRVEAEFQGYKATDTAPYLERLQYEISVIEKMGFSRYFLLVEDVVRWAKSQGIRVGPGRGSVGGSLVAFLMGITDVDPIRFGLFFERFTNPDRKDLPDIDLDFQSSRRHEVLQYLVDKYGSEYCAAISNYSMLGSSSALRDVARVHGLHESEYACSKLVPSIHGAQHTLEEAAKEVPEIAKYKKDFPELWRHSETLQGVLRNYGQHAAGFVVADVPLKERAVVENRGKEFPVVNWDKRTVEDVGLVKMDILGLSTLDTLGLALDMIKDKHSVEIDFSSLPLDDEDTINAFAEGDTIGVFQFEGSSARRLLKDLGEAPDFEFMDIVAANALNRPGPIDSGLLKKYVDIRQGLEYPEYDHPDLEPVLSKSHSVPIYQESIMEIVKVLAGFSGAEADDVRKALGKKNKEVLQDLRQRFIKGCDGKLSEFAADELWSNIENYGAYSFNLSHAVEYSLLSYYSMYLKVNYPEQFFAAVLSIAKEEAQSLIVRDMRSKGIQLMPPNINESHAGHFVGVGGLIFTPFKAIKFLTEKTGEEIQKVKMTDYNVLETKGGKIKYHKIDLDAPKSFVDLEDFNNRRLLSGARVNVRQVENLKKVGAFSDDPLNEEFLIDQKLLMPGLTITNVQADREIIFNKPVKDNVVNICGQIKACDSCSLKDSPHCLPSVGSKPKLFVVTDCPTNSDGEKGKIMTGNVRNYLKSSLEFSGLTLQDCYFTSVVKAPKESGKQLTTSQILACSPFLEAELEVLNPPVIIALGRNAIKHFVPDAKGSMDDLCGTCHYDDENKRSIVFGVTPGTIYFHPDNQSKLDDVIATAADLLIK